MMASNVVIFDSVVVDIIQNGQAVSVSFRLRSLGSTIGPGVASSRDGLRNSIFPSQRPARDLSSSPEIVVPVSLKHVQKEFSLARIIHGDHFHANLSTGILCTGPSVFGGKAIFPLNKIPFALVFNIGHSRIAVV